jgi:hypothetical protein
MYIKTKIPTINQNYMMQETQKEQEEGAMLRGPQMAAVRDTYN